MGRRARRSVGSTSIRRTAERREWRRIWSGGGWGGDDDDDDDDDGGDYLWRAMVGENAIAMTMTGGAVGGMGGGGGRIVRDDDDEYEDIRHRRDGSIGRLRNLDAHVCLLATITRRVARRSPSSDRRLVITFSRKERVHREG